MATPKTRETGWIGSKFVGIPAATAAPAPQKPKAAAPSGAKTRETGWIGSQYVGVDAAMAGQGGIPKPAAAPGSLPAPAPAKAPPIIGSAGKKPGEWIGSKYVGPALPTNAPAPPPVQTAPTMQTFGAGGDVTAPAPPAPGAGYDPNDPGYTDPAVRQADANRQYEKDNPEYVEALKNYWAPDREDLLARLRAQSTQPQGATPTDASIPEGSRAQGAVGEETGGATAPKSPGAAPPGFEGDKWGDTTKGTSHKYVGGRILGQGGSVADILKDPKFAGWKAGSKPDLIVSPEGSVYDVIYDQGGKNQRPQWQYVSGGPAGTRNDSIPGNDPNGGRILPPSAGGVGAGGAGGAGGADGAGGAGSTGTGTGSSSSSSSASSHGYEDPAVYDAIMRLLARGEKPVTDADVREQYAPVAAESQRAANDARAAAAERMAFQGTNVGGAGGAYDAQVNSINERAGQAQSALMANLIGGELKARREDVVNALTLAQGQEKIALQAQLAALDREIEQQKVTNQNTQFYDRLGFDIGDREYYYNYLNERSLPG